MSIAILSHINVVKIGSWIVSLCATTPTDLSSLLEARGRAGLVTKDSRKSHFRKSAPRIRLSTGLVFRPLGAGGASRAAAAYKCSKHVTGGCFSFASSLRRGYRVVAV